MAIEIRETFEVEAPVDEVWRFLLDPENIVGCMPGLSLLEVVDDRNFVGKAKIKLGAMTMAYKGKIHFKDVDEAGHVLLMVLQGKDPSGGTVKGEITCRLTVLESGPTEMVTEAAVDLTGKAMQVGAGMIKGVSHQLFLQFAKTAKQRLEAATDTASGAGAAGDGEASAAASTAPVEEVPLKVISLLLKTLVAGVGNFFRRIFGGGTSS